MPGDRTCPECKRPLPEDARDGVCPVCSLRSALKFGSDGAPPEIQPPASSLQPLASAAPPPSAREFGDYELLEQIGRGGMGIVYKARQKSLDRVVALKMLLFGPQASPDFAKRFRAEAVLAASLQHPNIVAIHEVGVHEGQQFFVMDYVAGPSLAQLVGHQPLPARRAAGYLKAIAEAIHYAHERGILHRDLKPSNVLIDAHDQPRVTDFGLAKRFEVESQVTLTGQVLGSPNYIPPEQALGKRGKVSRQSDVYALGAMLYHLLTGRPPFQGETLADTLQQVLNTEPLAPRLLNPRIARDLETICLKCLEKEALRRYPTAQQLAEELGRFLDDKPIQARPVSVAGKAWKWSRRRPALAGMGTALVLTFVLGLAGVLWQWHRARQNAQAELRQRERAEASEYAADMHLAQLAVADNNRALAVSLLDKYRPLGKSEIRNPKSEIDLRGWEWRYLWQLCHGDELFTLHRYPRAINALAVSKEGKLLAVATYDEVALWDLTTRRPLTGMRIRATPALAFSPTDDRLLAVGTWNAAGQPVADLWDVNAGKVTKSLAHGGWVKSLAFSPDGKLLATFDSGGGVRVADWASGQNLTEFAVPPIRYGYAGVVVFSPDGRRLAIGEDYGRLRLLDLRTGTFVTCQTQTPEGINTLAFSPTSELLAAGLGYGEGTIGLWDARSGEPRGQLTNHTDDVMALAFTADGRQLASASVDGTIRVWSAADRTELGRRQSYGEGLMALALLPGGRTLVSGGSKGSVCFWDATPTSQPPVHTNLAVSPLPDSFSGLEASAFAPETLDPRAVLRCGLAFTPDSRSFITTELGGALARWDACSWRRVETLPALGSNHWGVALSSDGHWLATGDFPGSITLWDWTTRHAVTSFTVRFGWFGGLRFSRRDHYLIATTARNDFTVSVRVWRTGDWVEAPLTGGQFQGLWAVDLSPDDRLLAAGYANGAVKLFRFPSAELEATLTTHNGPVPSVLFSPDGCWLASTSLDGSSRIWDVVARRELPPPLQGHFGDVCGSALSPDGRRLATGGSSARDAVKLWDLMAHRELLSLHAEGKYFIYLAFSPDGNTLVATCLSGIAHLWRAPSWAEIETAEEKQKVQ